MTAVLETSETRASALSVTGRSWALREADERQVQALMQRHGLPEPLARILAIRGVDVDDVQAFLHPSLKESLPDPSHLLDMDTAASRVAAAVRSGERIAIWGDYDVDGATSSALLLRYLRALGADPIVYIPDRMKEGYGPNAPALLRLREQGCTLAITVDCGTLAFEPLAAARAAGLEVIVIDHHLGAAELPVACAVVNPNRLDETSPHGHLAAVGVAFLLCVAVNRELRAGGGVQEPDLRGWLDIVALGTICDVVPLTGVNRALVAQGLKVMAARGNTGIRTVMDLAGVDALPSAYHAGFVIGPRINAGGRVGRSDLGVRLLSTDDPAEALAIARELETHNEERKAIERMMLEDAMAMAESQLADSDAPLLMISGKGWHPGVLGIVAGRMKERFHKPTAVIGVEGGIGKASARSVEGFDFGAAVIAARDAGLLLAGGGHAMAAGFTVQEENIPALKEYLVSRAKSRIAGAADAWALPIDAAFAPSGLTVDMVDLLERVGPFGQGNPPVRIAVSEMVNLRPQWTKDGAHARTLLVCPVSGAKLSAIAFRAAGTPLGEMLIGTRGRRIRVAGQAKINQWQGERSVSFQIEDIAES